MDSFETATDGSSFSRLKENGRKKEEHLQAIIYTSRLDFAKQGKTVHIGRLSQWEKGAQNSQQSGNVATCLKGGGFKPLFTSNTGPYMRKRGSLHPIPSAEALLVHAGLSRQCHSALSN